MTLLSVRDLTVTYRLDRSVLTAVDEVSIEVEQGRTLGLIGESGCGKSTLGLALMRLLPANAAINGGSVVLAGKDVLLVGDDELRALRWTKLAMVFQSAMSALNPVRPARTFLEEALRAHTGASDAEVRRRVAESFELVGLPADRADSYPHELSGGMKQRVMIALSLVCNPSLLIADEPTTALDVVVQDQVMAVLKSLQRELGFALILISHDMALIAENSDQVAVMYAGQVVEQADAAGIFAQPRHPYTIALMRSVPRLHGPREPLPSLPGQPPDLLQVGGGCRFAPRCALAEQLCHDRAPAPAEVRPGAWSRCHFATDDRMEALVQAAGADQ